MLQTAASDMPGKHEAREAGQSLRPASHLLHTTREEMKPPEYLVEIQRTTLTPMLANFMQMVEQQAKANNGQVAMHDVMMDFGLSCYATAVSDIMELRSTLDSDPDHEISQLKMKQYARMWLELKFNVQQKQPVLPLNLDEELKKLKQQREEEEHVGPKQDTLFDEDPKDETDETGGSVPPIPPEQPEGV